MLVDRLQRIISVRSVAMLHSDFNKKLFSVHLLTMTYDSVNQSSLSAFAASRIFSAYDDAAKITGPVTDHSDGSVTFGTNTASDSSCFCSTHTGWSAMQTHLFLFSNV